MSLHRRDYESIAKGVGRELAKARRDDEAEGKTLRQGVVKATARSVIREIAWNHANFDADKFMQAVELEATKAAEFLV